MEAFIQYGDSPSVGTFIQGRDLFIVNTFTQCGKFYPVREGLFGVETFIQCGDFYPLWILLSSVETFV